MKKIKRLLREISTISDLGKSTNLGFKRKVCVRCGNKLDDSKCPECDKKYKN